MSQIRLDALDLPLAGLGTAEFESERPAHAETLHLFDTCGISLFRYVRSLGLDADSARDVVQETFLALFRHLRLERPRDNLKGWIFRVAHNLSLKHRARLKQRQTDAVPDEVLAQLVVDPALNPEERLAEEQRVARLRAVMRALPERDRQCLVLRAEGLRYREIAAVLGVSLGLVSKSLTRAFARLGHV